ncbi:class 1 isoprenoid biosynthesis enzyme, partial [Shewanella sp. C32]
MATYAHKSGAVYGMACAMAARLAAGTGPAEIDPWRRFGQLLGLLAQFRNDADDLRSGRYEDLRNGTATYLLVHLLHSAPES